MADKPMTPERLAEISARLETARSLETPILAGYAEELLAEVRRLRAALAVVADAGKLSGYRIPGSTHRRVAAVALAEFIVEHGMPMPEELLAWAPKRCTHDRLTMEGQCRSCGADCRGIGT